MSVFELPAIEAESLMVDEDSFLVEDLGLESLNVVVWVGVYRDIFAFADFNVDHHPFWRSKFKVKMVVLTGC